MAGAGELLAGDLFWKLQMVPEGAGPLKGSLLWPPLLSLILPIVLKPDARQAPVPGYCLPPPHKLERSLG